MLPHQAASVENCNNYFQRWGHRTLIVALSGCGVKEGREPTPSTCVRSCMLEAVRASAGRTIDIDIVNRVLIQPHWQKEIDITDF